MLLYNNFETILTTHADNIHAFYIFLAFTDNLDFSNSEENIINSFFCRNVVSNYYCYFD